MIRQWVMITSGAETNNTIETWQVTIVLYTLRLCFHSVEGVRP